MAIVKYNEKLLESGNYTEAKIKNNMGTTIHNWRVVHRESGADVVVGFTDPDNIFSDIRTSVIVSIDEEAGELHTLNSIYKLGNKLSS